LTAELKNVDRISPARKKRFAPFLHRSEGPASAAAPQSTALLQAPTGRNALKAASEKVSELLQPMLEESDGAEASELTGEVAEAVGATNVMSSISSFALEAESRIESLKNDAKRFMSHYERQKRCDTKKGALKVTCEIKKWGKKIKGWLKNVKETMTSVQKHINNGLKIAKKVAKVFDKVVGFFTKTSFKLVNVVNKVADVTTKVVGKVIETTTKIIGNIISSVTVVLNIVAVVTGVISTVNFFKAGKYVQGILALTSTVAAGVATGIVLSAAIGAGIGAASATAAMGAAMGAISAALTNPVTAIFGAIAMIATLIGALIAWLTPQPLTGPELVCTSLNRQGLTTWKKKQNCFPANAVVWTPGQRALTMSQLKMGTEVATLDSNGKIVPDQIHFFGHRNPSTLARFVRLTTKGGQVISLSPGHLIPVAAT
jgi:hypothetical protein